MPYQIRCSFKIISHKFLFQDAEFILSTQFIHLPVYLYHTPCSEDSNQIFLFRLSVLFMFRIDA